jgi:hypothetical protein
MRKLAAMAIRTKGLEGKSMVKTGHRLLIGASVAMEGSECQGKNGLSVRQSPRPPGETAVTRG